MWTRQSRTLYKIQASRHLRGAFKNIKKRFNKSTAGTPISLIRESITPVKLGNREQKYKSTLAVAVAGTAIGVSHVAAVSSKYNKSISGKSTLGIGIAVGAITSAIWYKYIDAAYDGVTEDDISMMFEMANSTGYGSLDDDNDSVKAVDILHTIVTGKVDNSDTSNKSMFTYEEDSDDEDTSEDTDGSMFDKKVSFSDDKPSEPSTIRKSSFSSGIGKSLNKSSSSRKSFLPDLDRQEAESDKVDVADGWMDFS